MDLVYIGNKIDNIPEDITHVLLKDTIYEYDANDYEKFIRSHLNLHELIVKDITLPFKLLNRLSQSKEQVVITRYNNYNNITERLTNDGVGAILYYNSNFDIVDGIIPRPNGAELLFTLKDLDNDILLHYFNQASDNRDEMYNNISYNKRTASIYIDNLPEESVSEIDEIILYFMRNNYDVVDKRNDGYLKIIDGNVGDEMYLSLYFADSNLLTPYNISY